MASHSEERQRRLRHALVIALTVNAGATDAIGFLALGGAFTSVMTGNLVLFGISIAHGDGGLALHAAAAIACFVLGCGAGARLAGSAGAADPVWPAAVTRALLVEFAVFTGYAIGWWALGDRPHGVAQLALLAVNAVGLGIQSATVQRFGVPGLSTTYMTGTLTTVVSRLTSGHRLRDIKDSGQLLVALIVGASAGSVAVHHAPVIVPALQLVTVGGVIVTALRLTPARDGVAAGTGRGAAASGRPYRSTPPRECGPPGGAERPDASRGGQGHRAREGTNGPAGIHLS